MTDGYIQVPVDSTGKKVGTVELTRDDLTVIERQEIVVADPTKANDRAAVGRTDPGAGDPGLTVRPIANSTDDAILGLLTDIRRELRVLNAMFATECGRSYSDFQAKDFLP